MPQYNEMTHDDVQHIMEYDDDDEQPAPTNPDSIVKPKKKRTITPEHLQKMREGRKRYLEAKRKQKETPVEAPIIEEEYEVPRVPVTKARAKPTPAIRKRRVKTVNNYYYQEPEEEEEEEEDSSTDEDVENNYYGGSVTMDAIPGGMAMSGMRFV